MTLRELHYLVALADKQNFGRAAEHCHVGQPTLSMQLKKLEDYLEITLFERDNHHVRPTPIGEEVIERARIALEAVEEIRGLARQARDPMAGVLRMGVIPTLGPYMLPRLLPILKRTYPALRLFVHEDITASLLESLRDYRLDVLLVSLPVGNGDLAAMPLFREPLVAALPPGHPLAGESNIAGDRLERCMLVLAEGHCLREQALGVLGPARSLQPADVDAASLEMLRQLVAAGVGYTLLPALAAFTGETESVCLRPFTPPVPARSIGLVWRCGFSRSATIRVLGHFLHIHLPAHVDPIPLDTEAAETH